MHCRVNSDVHLMHSELSSVKSLSRRGGGQRQRAMIYGLRRNNWWLVVTESHVFIDLCFVFWITILDLLVCT